MFTTYIKNLNDMVFPTSESPEEQRSPGVLGRIGSWFSPWRVKSPTSPTENTSTTGEQALKSEAEEENEESVRPQAKEQQREEEQSFSPSPPALYRDIFPCEEENVRHSAIVSSTEAAGTGASGEEFLESRKKGIGLGKENEENGNGTSESGNPKKNASNVRDFSSEPAVISAHAQRLSPPQTQTQTGKKIHVYLEDTSVIQCGPDRYAGKEVVRTKVPKSLQIAGGAKSSQGFDSPHTSTATGAQSKRANVRPSDGSEGVIVEGSLKSYKEAQLDPHKGQTDRMGRRNAARRKSRKNSQGDGGNSPHEKKSPGAENVPEGFPSDNSGTSLQGKTQETHTADSSSKNNPTPQTSPEIGEGNTSCSDRVEKQENILDTSSVTADAPASVIDGAADMEDDDSLYKVERKTETPESKRRSIKVSQSEVKLFTKTLHLNPKQNPAKDNQDLKSSLKKDEAIHKPKPEIQARHDLRKMGEDRKPVSGRIADKISLFESPAKEVNKALQNSRSADASPVRTVTDRLKGNSVSLDQRSRSVECYVKARSNSASPNRERLTTFKERVRTFAETPAKHDTAVLPPKSGMSQKPTSSVAVAALKTGKLDSQGKLDAKDQIQANTKLEVTSKPDGPHTIASGEKSISKERSTESKVKDTVDSKTADRSRETNSVEAKVSATESGDSVEQTNNSNPQSKGPSRTSSRTKRRRSRESPKGNNENKEDCSSTKSVITSGNQQHVDDTVSASEQFAVSLSDKAEGKLSDEQFFSDSKQKAFQKEPKVKDKALHSSFIKENVDEPVSRQDSEPSINKDEPNTAACFSGTKPCIDMESVVSLPTEETTGENRLLFTQEAEKATDSRETTAPSSSSPALVQGMEKQDPPVHSRLDKASLVQLEQKSKGTAMEPNKNDTGDTQQLQLKDTGMINHSEGKGMEKSDKSDQTNQTEKTDKETPQQVTDSNKNVKESVAVNDKKKSAGKTHAETHKQELATESLENTISVPLEHTHITQVEISQETPACAITNTNNEGAESGIKSDREPLMGEADVSTRATESPGTITESVRIAVETQADSLLVEQMDNAPNVPCAHGANNAELSTANLLTSATSATEKVIVEATSDAPVLITTQADSVSEKDSSFEGPALPSAFKSVSRETAGCSDGRNTSAVKPAPLEDAISADIMDVTPECLQGEASKSTESTRDCSLNTSMKGVEKMELQPGGVLAITHTADVEGKTFYSPLNEHSPVGNDDISLHALLHTLKKETVNDKASHIQKDPANKLIPDSIHHSSLKKLTLPRGFSKDDSVTQQDSPSSWLDVDLPKERFKMPVPKLSASGSESNLLDTSGELDDNDFVEKIKKLCAPFSLPLRKHNPLGPPQPPFAMPAIKEDRFEKPFDPEQFNFGLRKNNKYTIDTTPSTLAKLQKTDGKSGPKSARASLADRSILLGSLDTHSRLKTPLKDEEQANEEKGEQVKVKSRLEGSCVLSSLTSSIYRGKRNGVQAQAEATNSGSLSNTQLSPPPPLSPTASTAAPQKDMPAKQSPAPDNREEAQAVVSDSGPPFPSFSDIKLPDYLEKYLPREPTTQNIRGQKQVKTEVSEKMPTQSSEVETDLFVKPSPGLPHAVPPSFPGNAPTAHPIMTDHKQPATRQPQDILSKNIQKRTAKGFHKRPGKMVLFENAQFSGQAYEVYRDVADATSLKLSSLLSVKVVRGCWVLYESPGFQGRSIALEEGGIELTNVWAENGLETELEHIPPMVIGSIRLAVSDYSIPRIDLYSEPEGLGIVTSFHDDTIETGSFGIPLSTASIQVQSGVWLVFSDPGFQGMLAVLEMGEYPVPETWGFSSPFVGSLRPLKMGGFKVENASEVKAVVYEKPGFQGSCLEVDGDVYSFCESEDGENLDSKKPKSVGSLKIIGGLWVGYSEPGFEGQQHILEEGEYVDCSEWGGSEHLQSLQPVLSDLLSPHLKMFRDREFGGASIDLSVPVINMEDTGYGMKTQSVDVISGVWVVFEEPGFCGDCYILETGLYGCSEDWGALQPRIASAMPVVLSDFENTAKFKVQLFSEPGFQGSALVLEDSVASLKDGFSVGSCKVLAGNWLAFEGQDFSGRMYVLEVGRYSDLKSMGFLHRTSSIQSLQIVGFEFSLPSITLFERSGLRGKKVILNDGTVNLQLAGGCSRVQSVLVEGGMWVLYEGLNYRGAQMFLKPGEVLDWYKFSSWLKIGSLRPLTQKQVHFRLRNKQTGLLMSVTGDLDDIKMMRIQETEETDGFEQIWFYQNGYLHCKLLEQCFLCHSGSVMMAGSRIGLTAEPDNQVWNISPEGIIYYTPTPDLVLDVKGGHHYDKNQVILNKCDPNKLQQKWTVEIL